MPFQILTVDPGHFHAALIQKEMYPGVSPRVAVYAALGRDLIEHLNRIARFNHRAENPTAWELDIHTSGDFLRRIGSEPAGSIVVLSGRNRVKIGYIRAALEAGFHVLADKPWIIRPEDLPALEDALATAAAKRLVAYDIMTERYEITTVVQRELINDPAVFGAIVPGTAAEPAVSMESVHHILKLVAGVPNLRPAWFFDVEEQGEALADVGTHLVDMVAWTLFPDTAIDRSELELTGARRWPTQLAAAQFRQVTGEAGEGLDYYCNTSVTYTLRGIHTRLDVLWNWESPSGDTHRAVYRGSKSRIEVRQGKAENYRPEVYVVPADPSVVGALPERVAALAARYAGLGIENQGGAFRVTIPDSHRLGHEAHFAQVSRRFFEYLRHPETFPAWENPNMLAKYYVSTKGVELSRR